MRLTTLPDKPYQFYCGVHVTEETMEICVDDLASATKLEKKFWFKSKRLTTKDWCWEICKNLRQMFENALRARKGIPAVSESQYPNSYAKKFDATCIVFSNAHIGCEKEWRSKVFKLIAGEQITKKLKIMHEADASLLLYQDFHDGKLDAVVYLGDDVVCRVVKSSEGNEDVLESAVKGFTNPGSSIWIARHAIDKIRREQERIPQNDRTTKRKTELIEELCKTAFPQVENVIDCLEYIKHESFKKELLKFTELMSENTLKDQMIMEVFNVAGQAIGEVISHGLIARSFKEGRNLTRNMRRPVRILLVGEQYITWLYDGIQDRLARNTMVCTLEVRKRKESAHSDASRMAAMWDRKTVRRDTTLDRNPVNQRVTLLTSISHNPYDEERQPVRSESMAQERFGAPLEQNQVEREEAAEEEAQEAQGGAEEGGEAQEEGGEQAGQVNGGEEEGGAGVKEADVAPEHDEGIHENGDIPEPENNDA